MAGVNMHYGSLLVLELLARAAYPYRVDDNSEFAQFGSSLTVSTIRTNAV